MQVDSGPPGVVWVAELKGARLAYVEEPAEDGRLRLERVKAITGGGQLVGARKYGHPFTFPPTHTLVVATNHRPNVNSAEHAAWRRLRLDAVPLPLRRPPATPPDVLATGRPTRPTGTAAPRRAAGGRSCLGRRRRRLRLRTGRPRPPGRRLVRHGARRHSHVADTEDVVGRFIAERVTITGDPNDDLPGLELFDAYVRWCEASAEPPSQAKTFYSRWTAHDDVVGKVESYVSHGARRFRGVKLRLGRSCDQGSWGSWGTFKTPT